MRRVVRQTPKIQQQQKESPTLQINFLYSQCEVMTVRITPLSLAYKITLFFILFSLLFSCLCLRKGRRIPITLPNTGALARKRNSFYLRAIVVICLVLFAVLQLHLINSRKYYRVLT